MNMRPCGKHYQAIKSQNYAVERKRKPWHCAETVTLKTESLVNSKLDLGLAASNLMLLKINVSIAKSELVRNGPFDIRGDGTGKK